MNFANSESFFFPNLALARISLLESNEKPCVDLLDYYMATKSSSCRRSADEEEHKIVVASKMKGRKIMNYGILLLKILVDDDRVCISSEVKSSWKFFEESKEMKDREHNEEMILIIPTQR